MIHKKYLIFIFLMISIFVFTGCTSDEQKDTIQKAQQVSLAYFKENYGVDVQFTEHKFLPADLSHNVSLSGHIENNKETEVTILVNYDTFEVKNAIVPKELLDLKK
ncbi:hypothetical protein [Paenibacillus xylanilyticus]|uniref:DUF1433 domain-containing protein n=1 Tax=Paenibacillus xylanilyticus TaxID=248903 RepID=A0A7Y6BZV0_9BACL|nr:hypothetical protein [Paenibacillus xylanilyticus]NUU78017.1 hypothetical protein [Paenibacillus xylanilyticus]